MISETCLLPSRPYALYPIPDPLMSKLVKRIPQVAVILEAGNKSTRDMLTGITNYARIHGPWALPIIEGKGRGQRLYQFDVWGGTGIIGLIQSPDVADYILKANLPTVIIDPEDEFQPPHPLSKLSTVSCDTEAIGRFAADYFMAMEFKHYGFVGEINNVHWSRYRGQAFQEQLQKAGFNCHVYGSPPNNEARDWALEHGRLSQWLKSLPKPIAILAGMDARGHQVIEACLNSGISVPYEVAVLGVDNDELLCESTFPPMSSILMDAKDVFFYAAEILDRLMQRKIRKKTDLRYGPKCVVTRRSTDPVNCVDKLVSQALDFIWINSGRPFNISHIAGMLDISRRTLEKRFREKVGTSISQEINRIRLEKAKSLLLTTDLSISEITALCGYNADSYLGILFKKKYGMTMTKYRQTHLFRDA